MRRWDRQTLLLLQVAVTASVLLFFYFLRQNQVLLYGDAVAHQNIARRVFDSRTPGPLQLGTVWLPLPHLLMLPFVISDFMWQSGIGASIPSLFAYLLSVLGIFRLVRGALGEDRTEASASAWVAALIFGANPNLLYLQSTAMTEPLYLCLFIWSVVYFAEFARDRESSALLKSGWCVLGATLTRYDGWFLAATLMAIAAIVCLRGDRKLRRAALRFLLICAAGPLLWIGYNWAVYKNPLEFATGRYSAHAIDARSVQSGVSPRPGAGSLKVATEFFVKSAELNLKEGAGEKLWPIAVLAGAALGIGLNRRRRWPLLLLLLPLPFYALSIAYGGIPIYVPVWWPFSYYNVRYGIELLPAAAVFSAVLVGASIDFARPLWAKTAIVAVALALVAVSYIAVWRAQPISFREAEVNSRSRLAFERELAVLLRTLPPQSNILMYVGDHAGAVQDAGIPFRRTINEGNHRTWKQPYDPQGLWEKALREPAKYADYVVAFAGDPVWTGANPAGLASIAEIHGGGGERAVIYQTRTRP
jgi:hypothetical protein